MKKKSDPAQSPIKLPCRHKFEKGAHSYSQTDLAFRCALCGDWAKRPHTRAEKKVLQKYTAEERKRTNQIHGTYWDFCKNFKDNNTGDWVADGFDLMQAIEEWADKVNKKKPERVLFGHCDDNSFTSSLIVFITGEDSAGGYWGTHAVVISQCDGEPPKEFFLYPGHARTVAKVLAEIGKRAKKKESKTPWPFKESTFEGGTKPCSKKRSKPSGPGSTTSRPRSPKKTGKS